MPPRRSLLFHVKEKHSGDIRIHPCPFCGKNFTRKTNLDVHLDFQHYGKKAFCLYCDESFASRGIKNRHIRKAHGKSVDSEEMTKSDETEAEEKKLKEDVEEFTEDRIQDNQKEVVEATEKEALEATEKEALQATEKNMEDQEETFDELLMTPAKLSKVANGFHCQEPGCPMAKTAFESKYSLRMHFYRNHVSESEKVHVCEYCQARFALREAIQ